MKYEFVNPYNFVPISKNAPERSDNVRGEDTLTGVIEYSILTKTPLIVPNTSNDQVFGSDIAGHKSYDFFSYNDLSERTQLSNDEVFEPVIPGSEIRGLIRSNYEILTNSCLSSLDSDEIMNKRAGGAFKPGVIKKCIIGGKTTYDLYGAKDHLFRSKSENCLEDADENSYNVKSFIQKDLREGQKINFKAERKNDRNGRPYFLATQLFNGPVTGYVIKGQDIKTKHNCHIFVPTDTVISKTVNLTVLEQVLKAYKNSKSHIEYSEEFDKFKSSATNGEYFPVYYSILEESDVVFLAPACFTKEVYLRTLTELVGEHKTCDNINNLCPACRLFGTVIGKGKTAGLASKIRFTDMRFVADSVDGGYKNAFLNPLTLVPLLSPKLNNMEFYLERPADDAVFWTYDYYVDNVGNVHKNTSGINGRKFYWHNMKPRFSNQERTNLNVTVRPVKAEVKFEGKMYFEGITKTELNDLIYTLNAGDEADLSGKSHGYKFGGAKPLGLGSIAINVDRVVIRSILKTDYEIKYTENEYHSDGVSINPDIQYDFEKMTSFNAVTGKNVKYPQRDDDPEIYAWFVWNHQAGRAKTKRGKEVYIEYMKPMESELQPTGALDNSNDTRQHSSPRNNNANVARQQGEKSIGTVCKGIVKGHNKTGKWAYIKLENGNDISAFDDGKIKESTTVSVSYNGIDSRTNRENWKIVRQ